MLKIDTISSRMEREYGHPPGGVKLVVLATETPQGLLNIRDFGSCPRVDSLSWGAEDLSAWIGARGNRDENGQFLEVFRYARIMTLLAATAANIQPLDTVLVDIKDTEGLRRDCLEGTSMGFTGKNAVHPDRIEVMNEICSPSPEENPESKIARGLRGKSKGRQNGVRLRRANGRRAASHPGTDDSGARPVSGYRVTPSYVESLHLSWSEERCRKSSDATLSLYVRSKRYRS